MYDGIVYVKHFLANAFNGGGGLKSNYYFIFILPMLIISDVKMRYLFILIWKYL